MIMKTLLKIFFLMAVISLVAGCNKDALFEDQPTEPQLKKAQVEVIVPFKADFTVWDHSDYTDLTCGGFPIFHLTMIGEGVATHLGKLSTTMTFCCNVQTGEYGNTSVIFIAANGDELYASTPIGYIVPNDEENSNRYGAKFNDPMYFTGGTGRFEGASGMAMTNAYVHDPDRDEYVKKGDEVWHTDFFSEGTITLKKGNK
jgi:hypothetical protein